MYTIELQKVRKTYGEFVAVNDISFSIEQGSVFGLLGPNGAGKTSTIRMMIGITAPDSGSIGLFGRPFTRDNLGRIGYLPEERGLYKKMKVLDQLQFLGQLHGLTAADARQRSVAWCRRLEISEKLQSKVEELSKGMQQKIQFIAALLHDPDFVIMDEPFFGLDPVNAGLLKDVLLDVKKNGKTILFSTHRMDQVEKLCDAICLIDGGKPVLQGSLKEVKSRFGKNNIQIQYEGDGVFLENNPLVRSFNDYGNYVELQLAPGADPQQLMRQVMERARVSRFELMEPSLEEIFKEVVGKPDA
ncbi:MAG TPA: ATP-binding cassette domain-containing protein [Candidatus Saccharimonadales bacterium]|jgi:ABC-2 type transport system ATP-binding protein|nr:ATP-binding cassette domain-containing protein [Candidatus Saccharimonadales bacterium]